MKLFTARIRARIPEYHFIPVAAESAEEALAYLNGTREWHKDGGLTDAREAGAQFNVVAVECLDHPRNSLFDADAICWSAFGEELEVSAVWADAKVIIPDVPDDESMADAYGEYRDRCEEARKQFVEKKNE